MFDAETIAVEVADGLQGRLEAVAVRALNRTAFRVMTDARESIQITRTPSRPGQPPHSRRGRLPQSIAFAVEDDQLTAFIGPRYSKVNRIGETMEFGGMFRGRNSAARPFMRPAMERNLDFFVASFGGG